MGLSYQDVYLTPRYSPHMSRSEINTSVQFGPQKFRLPIIPANMACTIDTDLARWMSRSGYFYIMHRFGTKPESITPEQCAQDNYEFVRLANAEQWETISISVGVQKLDMDLVERIVKENLRVDYITVDIAHAHSVRMKNMLQYLKEEIKFPYKTPFIIAGNVATGKAVSDLELWGADCVKVGIAQGGACTTYGQTGFGVPMFSCMLECSNFAKGPLIADGGIKDNGDFAKAIVAGATMVMAGSKFASSINSPAETVIKYFRTDEVIPQTSIITDTKSSFVQAEYKEKVVKKVFKRYYGSASSYNKHSDKHVEGTMVELECDGTTYEQKLRYLEGHLQSSISYSGDDLNTVSWSVKGLFD